MQFIRNIMNDIKKCIRIAAKMRNWWRRSSKAARITSSVLLASLLIAWLCFIIFETVNMVSYSSRYSAKLQNSVLIQREKNAYSDNLGNKDNEVADNKSFEKYFDKYCKQKLDKSTVNHVFWKHPTGGEYPNLSGVKVSDLKVNVDLKKQRVHILANGKTVYTMIMSSGMDDSTPHGDYHINMRGKHFFNYEEKVGADYWVGFIGGEYLFHSVPTRYNFGEYIPSEGMKLGKPASHGCVRLSVADAKWFYKNIPDGTAVHIR